MNPAALLLCIFCCVTHLCRMTYIQQATDMLPRWAGSEKENKD